MPVPAPMERAPSNNRTKRAPLAAKRAPSQDLNLERFHSQELIQNEAEGAKVEMQHNAQVVSQPYAKLNNGKHIPYIGLGTFKTEGAGMDEAVHAALRAGYRHIDCAEHYGNEPSIGESLEAAFNQGFARREETWITTKLWTTEHKYERVRPALMKSLKDLRLEYIDLWLIHWPVTEPQKEGDVIDPPIEETWAAMEELCREGLVRTIGVSNFSIAKLKNLLSKCKIRPAVNQVEVHPFWRNDELIQFCASEGIHVSAYCPMGTPWTSAKAVIRRAQSVSSHAVVKEVAKRYSKHPLAILIRWGIQHGTSVLVKSSNPHHIRGNLEGALGWKLSDEHMAKISGIEFQLRLVDGIRFLRPEGPYRTMKDLWDEDFTDECRVKFINRMYKFPEQPTFTLPHGAKIPILGLGTWKDFQVSNTVQRALRRGFRHIDCSSQPDNEEEIGKAMQEIFSDWIVNRPDVFVTAKLQAIGDGEVEKEVDTCLKRLQLDYLDLMLMPVDGHTDDKALEVCWRSLEKLVRAGKLKAIGCVNASQVQLKEILEFCSIKPAVNSLEVHPYCRNDRLVQFCRYKKIHVMASSWPATAYMLHRKDAPAVLRDETVVSKARMIGKHPAQILIRWAIQHDHNVSPKAGNDEHIKGILDVLNWELPEEHYLALCRLPQSPPQGSMDQREPSTDEIEVLEHLHPPKHDEGAPGS